MCVEVLGYLCFLGEAGRGGRLSRGFRGGFIGERILKGSLESVVFKG